MEYRNSRFGAGFVAGTVGGGILVVLMYILSWTGLAGDPGFVGTYHTVFGTVAPIDHLFAALLFMISGGIWGGIFTSLVRRPTPLYGAVFALAPTLWTWLVVAPMNGKPLFNGFAAKGILFPLLFNVVVWGTFVGWYCGRRRGVTTVS